VQVSLGDFDVSLEVDEHRLIRDGRATGDPDLADPVAELRRALEIPHGFPELRRALTPDDRIVVIVDELLPRAGALIGELIAYLIEAGIDPAAVTLLSRAGSPQAWIDDLPDAAQDVRTAIHDPTNRKAINYLASTRAGRRVYVNRTVAEADQIIVLAGCRYDSQLGVHDGPGALFPAMADADTLREVAAAVSMKAPGEEPWPIQAEANEVAYLLGVPFFVQVVAGSGDGVAHVLGGTVEVTGESRRALDARWRTIVSRPAHTVIATVTGPAGRQDFETLSRAALCAARVVEPGGRIVLLSKADPTLGEAGHLLRQFDDPVEAARIVRDRAAATDRIAALQWLEAARHADLYLLSAMPDDVAEELFATPMQKPQQAQKLAAAADSVLVIEDADKALAVVESN